MSVFALLGRSWEMTAQAHSSGIIAPMLEAATGANISAGRIHPSGAARRAVGASLLVTDTAGPSTSTGIAAQAGKRPKWAWFFEEMLLTGDALLVAIVLASICCLLPLKAGHSQARLLLPGEVRAQGSLDSGQWPSGQQQVQRRITKSSTYTFGALQSQRGQRSPRQDALSGPIGETSDTFRIQS